MLVDISKEVGLEKEAGASSGGGWVPLGDVYSLDHGNSSALLGCPV